MTSVIHVGYVMNICAYCRTAVGKWTEHEAWLCFWSYIWWHTSVSMMVMMMITFMSLFIRLIRVLLWLWWWWLMSGLVIIVMMTAITMTHHLPWELWKLKYDTFDGGAEGRLRSKDQILRRFYQEAKTKVPASWANASKLSLHQKHDNHQPSNSMPEKGNNQIKKTRSLVLIHFRRNCTF